MGAEAWRPRLASMAAAGLLAGCASTSIRDDLDDVRELARAITLSDVSRDVDTESDADAITILRTPLDADGAVRVALLMNRELRATLREIGVVRGHLLQAGLLPNPLIEAELLPERNTEASLRVEWDLAGLVLAPMRAHAASAEVDVSRYAAADAVVATGLGAREAFYAVQAASERLAIAQRALDALAASRDAARALALAGNLPALDVAAYEAEFEEERARVADVELDLVVARETAHRALGLHGDETTSLRRARRREGRAPRRPGGRPRVRAGTPCSTCWGYNGGTPGRPSRPSRATACASTSRTDCGADDRALARPDPPERHGWRCGLNQRPIPPGETFVYEFTLSRPGTFMYHPHFDEMTQIALGMVGMFIVHPRRPAGPASIGTSC
jgi:hypothetical protein